jgi:hypothetical protein
MPYVARLDYDRPFQKHLRPGETLLWVGRPVQGIVFRRTDWGLIPFSLIWTSMAVWQARFLGRSLDALLNPCPTVVILGMLAFGVYLLVGRFVVDAWQRSRTWYGLSDRRALILYVGRTVCFNTVEGAECKAATLQRQADGSGTIIFETREVDPYWVGREGRGGFLDSTRPSSPAFEGIDAPDEVLGLLNENPTFADALKRGEGPPPPDVVRPEWGGLAFMGVALAVALGIAAYSDSQAHFQSQIPPGRGAVVVNPGAVNEQYFQATGDGRADWREPITREQYQAYTRLHARSRTALKVAAVMGVVLGFWIASWLKKPARAAVQKLKSRTPFLRRGHLRWPRSSRP